MLEISIHGLSSDTNEKESDKSKDMIMIMLYFVMLSPYVSLCYGGKYT